jgi:ribonucleotide reductase alpha subunit
MKVIKRDDTFEEVSFDKVLRRVQKLSGDLNINAFEIAQKIVNRIYDGVSTSELDELTSVLCSSLVADNPAYDKLATRIMVSNHHKKTSPSFSETIEILHNHKYKIISDELYEIVQRHKEKLNSYINYDRDYNFDYFGFKTLERAYLMRVDDKIIERPQHMFMRVAIGIHGDDIKDALETYDGMSQKLFLHATPTLFNFGTPKPQGSSCFLLHANDDSIHGIYESLSECASISKHAGGIGIHIHNIRGKNSEIRGTHGKSDGIIPMLRVFNSTARYVNQSGRRNGSIAVYLEPWHSDIEGFLDLKKNHGNEEERARDLFYALWIPDLFMERVKENGMWSLMCPDECRQLSEVYGERFKHKENIRNN